MLSHLLNQTETTDFSLSSCHLLVFFFPYSALVVFSTFVLCL